MHQFNWDNLRYLLAVSESGSIAGAASQLGVNRTTALRRIRELETQLQCPVFEGGKGGYTLTAEADQLLQAARGMETSLTDVARQVAGRETRLEGELRVTTTDALFVSSVSPVLAAFQSRYPHIRIELALSSYVLNLNKRDADVAIRPSLSPPENLVAERVGDIRYGIYASEKYIESNRDTPLEQQRWLGVDDPISSSPGGQWLSNNIPRESVCFRSNSFLALKIAAESGIGVALLPVALGSQSTVLRRIGTRPGSLKSGLWILAHPDLARSARVHAFFEFFTNGLKVVRGGVH